MGLLVSKCLLIFQLGTDIIIKLIIMITIIKVFVQHKILFEKTILDAYTHTYTQAPAHMSILTIQNYQTSQTDNKQEFEAEEDSTSSEEWKTWQLVFLHEDLLLFSVSLTQYCLFSLSLKIMPKSSKCSLVFVSINKYFLEDLHFSKRKQKVKK